MSGTKNNRERKKAGPPGQPRRSDPEHRGPSSSSGESVEVAGSGVESASGEALPEGWAWATLEEVTVKKVEQVKREAPLTYIDIGAIDNETKQVAEPNELGEGDKVPSRARQLVEEDDVLVSMTRPNLNAVAKVPKELHGAIGSTGFDILRAVEIEPEWLFQTVKSREFVDAMSAIVQGALYPAVRPGDVRAYRVPLAPKAEQSRIVSAIESLQERSSRARDLLSEVGPLIGQLRQSVLRGAFSGRLTADWRAANPDVQPASELLASIRTERRASWEAEQLAKYEAKGKKPPKNWQDKYKEPEPVDESELPELPEGWCWCRVGDLIESIDAGRSPTANSHPARDGESGVLKVSAVTWREFDPTANKALKDGDEIGDTPTPRAGDLLISRANTVELIGAVVLVKADFPNLMLSDKTLRLNPSSPGMPPEFILYGLRSPSVRDSFEANATGTSNSMRNLSQAKILEAPFALAPLEEQAAIVDILVANDEATTEVESGLASMESSLTQLDQSILSKAFRGELVPQDPRDEPASELLARIRTTREKLEAEKKAAKKKNSRKKK